MQRGKKQFHLSNISTIFILELKVQFTTVSLGSINTLNFIVSVQNNAYAYIDRNITIVRQRVNIKFTY